MKKSCYLFLGILMSLLACGQPTATTTTKKEAAKTPKTFFPSVAKYQEANFTTPVNIPVSLAGNFGECRPNHFHSGLDVRTAQRENLDLYSIGKGYVSGVTISHKGFGNCIYISHPGGYTSVYAHCNDFSEHIMRYVKRMQYQKEKWDVELKFPPHLFPIRKGQFIAKSGNTGSSHAPHLHMEIRNTLTDKTLNGLLFYPKMQDKKKPIINRLAVYDANKSIYDQEPKIFRAVKNGAYDVPTTELIKVNSDKVYFGIQANDFMENSLRLGVFRMKLFVDGKALFGWQLNSISYDETRYMNAIGDFKTRLSAGFWLQLCHRLPNDQLEIYVNGTQKNGVVSLADGRLHKVTIRVFDVKGNSKDLKFQVQGTAAGGNASSSNCSGTLLTAGKPSKFNNGKIAFNLTENLLYDQLCFSGQVTASAQPYSYMYHIAHAGIPVHDYFDLKLKPKQAIPENLQNKVAVIYTPDPEFDMEKIEGQAATYADGWVVATVRKFGQYAIVIDQAAPTVIPYFSNGTRVGKGTTLKFGAEDNISELKEVRMEVNGQWLRCARRKNNYYYKVDSFFPEGTHEVTIKAVDGNNNTTIKKFTLSRAITKKPVLKETKAKKTVAK